MFLPIKLLSIIFSSIVSFASIYSVFDISEPHATALSRDHDFSTKYEQGTFGHKYKNYFTSPSNNSSLGISLNDDWWNWIFENVWKGDNSKTGKFGSDQISKGYSSDDTKALNQVCNNVYKSQLNKITQNGTGTDEYKEENVWKFCSFFRVKPILVKNGKNNNTYTGEKIGKKKEDVLISFDEENNKFWFVRERESKLKDVGFSIDSNHKYFSNLKKQNKTIQEICKMAYELEASQTSTDSTPTEAEVTKYCSLDMEESGSVAK